MSDKFVGIKPSVMKKQVLISAMIITCMNIVAIASHANSFCFALLCDDQRSGCAKEINREEKNEPREQKIDSSYTDPEVESRIYYRGIRSVNTGTVNNNGRLVRE
jgi:hypothetical protein